MIFELPGIFLNFIFQTPVQKNEVIKKHRLFDSSITSHHSHFIKKILKQNIKSVQYVCT
jgi:hypothetical protein